MKKSVEVQMPIAMLVGLICLLAAGDAALAEPADKPSVAVRQKAERAEWEVSFPEEISLEEYARQIDFFKIEIAAVSKDGKAEYVAGVSQRKPVKRLGDKAADYRLHLGWKAERWMPSIGSCSARPVSAAIRKSCGTSFRRKRRT